MKNQSGAIKTNLELYRVVMGGSGGYRRLPGGSDDFLLQTLHHNVYISTIIVFIVIIITTIIITLAWDKWFGWTINIALTFVSSTGNITINIKM